MNDSPYQIIRHSMEAQYSKLHQQREEARNLSLVEQYLIVDGQMKAHREAMDKFYDLARFFKDAQV